MRDQSQDPMGGKRLREQDVVELREHNARLVAALEKIECGHVTFAEERDGHNWKRLYEALQNIAREALAQQSTEKP